MKNKINMSGAMLIGYDKHKHAIWEKNGDRFTIAYDKYGAVKLKPEEVANKIDPVSWEEVQKIEKIAGV